MTNDLAARIAETTALIQQELAADEAAALATISINDRAQMLSGTQPPRWVPGDGSDIRSEDDILRVRHTWVREREHITRNDPARVIRRVRATRDLAADILADQHYTSDVDYYSCSQAQEGQSLISGPTGPPGSGCSDPERSGHPCDCGRDARVIKRLDIIASEWETDGYSRG